MVLDVRRGLIDEEFVADGVAVLVEDLGIDAGIVVGALARPDDHEIAVGVHGHDRSGVGHIGFHQGENVGVGLELGSQRLAILVEPLPLDDVVAGDVHRRPNHHVVAIGIDGHVRLVVLQTGGIGVDDDVGGQRISGGGAVGLPGDVVLPVPDEPPMALPATIKARPKFPPGLPL